MGFSQIGSREAREIAREITRQMKESFGCRPTNFPFAGLGGYAGDESSYDATESDSASESEVITLTSQNSFSWNNQFKSASSHSESSVSQEARKRLSERWKIAHKCEEVGVVNRSSTLGEMLAISDKEKMPQNSDAAMCLDESSDGFASSNGPTGWESPLGISSRDGWKDGHVRNSSRSSLPLSTHSRSHKSGTRCEALVEERYLIPKETMNRGRSKAAKENFNQKRDLSSKNLNSTSKSSHSSYRTGTSSTDSSTGSHLGQVQTEIELTRKDSFEKQPMFSQTVSNDVACANSIIDAVADPEQENIMLSSKSSVGKLAISMSENGNSLALHQEDSNLQVNHEDFNGGIIQVQAKKKASLNYYT